MTTLAANAHAWSVIAFTLLAFFLFTRERIPIPVTSLAVVAGLVLGFHLFPFTYLKEYERSLGATLYDERRVGELPAEFNPNSAPEQQLVEVAVTEDSPLHRRRLKDARLAERFGVVILAMHRPRRPRSTGEIPDR